MNLLNSLAAICKNLNVSELKDIRSFLRTSGPSNSSSLNLFDTIVDRNEIDFDSLSILIYGKPNYEALKKLIQRLIDKILDYLISKEAILDSGIYDERNIETFNIKRKLLYYDVLNSHNVSNYALIVLDQVIRSCKKIEYYDYLIMALEKKLNKMSLGDGLHDYSKVFKEIEYYSDCNISLKRAKYLIRLYYTNNRYKQRIFKQNEIEHSVKLVHDDMIRTRSRSVKIQYHYLNGILLTNYRDNYKCLHNFLELNKFLHAHKQAFSSLIFVNCWLNIARFETLLFNFESSLKQLKLIRTKGSKGTFNDKMALEMEFVNYLYLGDFEKCKIIIDDLNTIPKYSKISSFIVAKRVFYSAVLHFLYQNYSESLKILNNCKILDQDKEGWNLGVRILIIMNSIELYKWNLVDSLIENLRKHVVRVTSSDVSPRFSVISKIFLSLERNSFDFLVTQKACNKELRLLSGKDKKYVVPLNSPEVILFHEWFDSKVKGVPYNHSEAMGRLKKANLQNTRK